MSREDPPAPPVRASDAERDLAADRLKDAAAEGRLTLEELAERSEAAYLAVSRTDLDQLLAGGDSIEPADEPPTPGAPVIHLHSVNVMGGNDVKRGPRRPSRWPWQRHLGHRAPPPPPPS